MTARQAAAVLLTDFQLSNQHIRILPASTDTPYLTALRQSTQFLRNIVLPSINNNNNNNIISPTPFYILQQTCKNINLFGSNK